MLKKISSGLLILTLLLVLLFVGWLCERLLDWPAGSLWLWVGIPILTFFSVRLFRKHWVRIRAKLRLREHGAAPISDEGIDPEWMAALRKFQEVTSIHDMPPWQGRKFNFVFGLPGSGKSTLLLNSGHDNHLFSNDGDPKDVTISRSCRLAYLDSGLVVEIAGRYVDPNASHESLDDDWDRLLNGIQSHVDPDQCSSIVVCIDVKDLETDFDLLREAFLIMRKRISALMTHARQRLPVYVVLTHADKLPYLSNVLSGLTDEVTTAPAGAVVTEGPGSLDDQIEASIEGLCTYLPWLGLRSQIDDNALQLQALFLGDEVRRYRGRLAEVLNSLFSPSTYLEPAIFRGLFISAKFGRPHLREHTSRPLQELAFGPAILESVLDADRLSRPLKSFEAALVKKEQRKVFGSYALCFAVLVWLVAGFLTERSFINDAKFLDLPKNVIADEIRVSIENLNQYGPAVEWVESVESTRWRYLFPFAAQTSPLREQVKTAFLGDFISFLKGQWDHRLMDLLEKAATGIRPTDMGLIAEYLVRRFNQLRLAAEDASIDDILQLPSPSTSYALLAAEALNYEDMVRFNRLYVDYLAWAQPEFLLRRLHSFDAPIERVANEADSLDWLLPWAENQTGVNDVYLSEFWSPVEGPTIQKVRGAYTRRGHEVILSFIEEMNQIDVVRNAFSKYIDRFHESYRVLRNDEWTTFVRNFSQGQSLLKTERMWSHILTTFRGEISPYRMLESRLINEYSGDDSKDNRPEWVTLLMTMQGIRDVASDSVINKVSGKLKVVDSSIKSLTSLGENRGVNVSINAHKSLIDAGPLNRIYEDALAKSISEAVFSPSKASGLASDYNDFSSDPNGSKSSLVSARNAERRLEGNLNFLHKPENDVVWLILRGELETTTQYAYKQAACSLQNSWNSDVLWVANNATTVSEAFEKIVGDKGVLWEFLDQKAHAFINRQSDRYTPLEHDGRVLAWDSRFIAFANDAIRDKLERDKRAQRESDSAKLAESQDSNRLKEIIARLQVLNKDLAQFDQAIYSVNIASEPVRANLGASLQPHGVSLNLECSENDQELRHLNFATQKTFQWNSQKCGDTTLTISIGDAKMIRRWEGPAGFYEFIEEYPTGHKVYRPADFGPFKDMLEEMGIKKLDVAFNIEGAQPFIQAIQRFSAEINERNALEAEKLKLEQAQGLRDQEKLKREINELSPLHARKLQLPELATLCDFK